MTYLSPLYSLSGCVHGDDDVTAGCSVEPKMLLLTLYQLQEMPASPPLRHS